MFNTIIDKLRQTEDKHNVKILYAVESGSRGWGFASTDSDYDVRFIYIHPTEWYLSIDKKKDFIEYPIDNELDINGWDIRKALQLFKKSNPPLLEWLSSPIVYLDCSQLAQKMRDLSTIYFSPVPALYHYLHIAKNSFSEISLDTSVKIKKCFYILRPLLACMWIEKYRTMPPMEFNRLNPDQFLDTSLMREIDKLLEKKASGKEIDSEPLNSLIFDFFNKEIHYYDQYLKTARKTEDPDDSQLNYLFHAVIKEVWG